MGVAADWVTEIVVTGLFPKASYTANPPILEEVVLGLADIAETTALDCDSDVPGVPGVCELILSQEEEEPVTSNFNGTFSVLDASEV